MLAAKLDSNEIVALQDECVSQWHDREPSSENENRSRDENKDSVIGLNGLIVKEHRFNFLLWHEEDFTRVPEAADAEIARSKRKIDGFNQERNDLMEKIDVVLLEWLAARALPNHSGELSSETPGQMIDRLSILALKIYHTREEVGRRDASPSHMERNKSRLQILETQRADLGQCLDALWAHVLAGTRKFKLYRQLKMYNDPSLNPLLYKRQG